MKQLTPETEAELAQMVAEAAGPLRIEGGGTRSVGMAPKDATVLTTRGLAGITLYEPEALTLVVRAGTPVADVEAALAAEGQRLAFEPMDHRPLLGTSGTPTIGGVVAGNVSGPRRIQVGAARDFMLGVRFVDGRGRILRNGGRVMKNVTGYDLVKLMAGSRGTLGVLTEVALKVLPGARATGTLSLEGLGDGDAVAALSAALGSPFEVTGAAHLPAGPKGGGGPVTMIRLEGTEASVAYRAEALRTRLAPRFGSARFDMEAESAAAAWAALRDVRAFGDQAGDVWRISVKPSDAPGLVARLGDVEAIYDWGGGLVWVLSGGGDLRARMGETPGHATLVRGGGDLSAFPPEAPAVAALSAGLRATFDPRGILNPGLMGAAA